MKMFAPCSAGSPKAIAGLTFLSVNQTFPFLARLITGVKKRGLLEAIKIESFCSGDESVHAAAKLNDLFRFYGSDKSNGHNYQLVYGPILKNTGNITRLLEIGIGTNNTDVVSYMDASFNPGASLRAFRDFLPKAAIFGADIDNRILFQEDRIKTFFVDQTDLQTFKCLSESVGDGFDLIIDDALHSPNANIATLIFAIDKLKNGGWFVIEDIRCEALPIWQVVAELLSVNYKPYLIETSQALVFAVQKTDEI
jgi:hypothetical protein